MPTAQFPKPESVGPRIWGNEILLAHAPEKWTMKLITMKQGAKGGLQYHRKKDEAGLMTKGKMLIRYDDGTGTLVEREVRAGDVFHFPAGSVHQAFAITTCTYIEVSNAIFNDRVHVEKEYGLESEEGGLPTTSEEEIEER